MSNSTFSNLCKRFSLMATLTVGVATLANASLPAGGSLDVVSGKQPDGVAAVAAAHTGIRIPLRSDEAADANHYTFRFDDALMGGHWTGNISMQDARSKTITMSAWVKLAAAQGYVMGHTNKEKWADGTSFYLKVADGKFVFNNSVWSDPMRQEKDTEVTTDQVAETGEWAFVTLVFDGTNNHRFFYYNGSLVADAEMRTDFAYSNLESLFFVGDGTLIKNQEERTNDAAMDLSEVQVWSKALTAEEVKETMENKVDSTAEGLTYLYRFAEKEEDNTYKNLSSAGDAPAALYYGEAKESTNWMQPGLAYAPAIVEAESVMGHDEKEPEPEQYIVLWQSEMSGALRVTVGEETLTSGSMVLDGTVITITASPYSSYYNMVDYVRVNGMDIENGSEYTVHSRTDITYNFKAKEFIHKIHKNIQGNGAVRVRCGNADLDNGDRVADNDELIITAEPSYGYKLASLKVNGEDFESGKKYIATSDVTIDAEFVSTTSKVCVLWTGVAHGSVMVKIKGGEVIQSGYRVEPGTVIIITASPMSGYEIDYLRANGKDIENGAEYTVESETRIDFAFKVPDGIDVAQEENDFYFDGNNLQMGAEGCVSVYDLSGRRLMEADICGELPLDGLAPGVYIAVWNGKTLKFSK